MSKPPEKSGSDIGAEEKRRRAEEKRKKRDENLSHASIREIAGAIDGVANQLSSNEEEQNASNKKRRFRETLTLWLLGFTFAAAAGGDVIFYRTMMDAKEANTKQLAAMEGQREVMENTLRISVRPWVGLPDDKPGLISSPLIFDARGNAIIDNYVLLTKNYSTAAAQNVFSIPQLVVTQDLHDVWRVRDMFCGYRWIGNPTFGNVLFGGRAEQGVRSGSYVARAEIVDRDGTGIFQAWMTGCIGYRDQFGHLYRTRFMIPYGDPKTQRPIRFKIGPNAKIPGAFLPTQGDAVQ